jgi:hypothetical protein
MILIVNLPNLLTYAPHPYRGIYIADQMRGYFSKPLGDSSSYHFLSQYDDLATSTIFTSLSGSVNIALLRYLNHHIELKYYKNITIIVQYH